MPRFYSAKVTTNEPVPVVVDEGEIVHFAQAILGPNVKKSDDRVFLMLQLEGQAQTPIASLSLRNEQATIDVLVDQTAKLVLIGRPNATVFVTGNRSYLEEDGGGDEDLYGMMDAGAFGAGGGDDDDESSPDDSYEDDGRDVMPGDMTLPADAFAEFSGSSSDDSDGPAPPLVPLHSQVAKEPKGKKRKIVELDDAIGQKVLERGQAQAEKKKKKKDKKEKKKEQKSTLKALGSTKHVCGVCKKTFKAAEGLAAHKESKKH